MLALVTASQIGSASQWVGETDLANELTDLQRGLWTATARS